MPTDKKIEEAIKPLVEMYSNIETDLLKEIASHFLIGEEFENADYYRIAKLEEMGAFNQKTIEYLASKTGATEEKIRECLEEIGISTIDTPELSKLYDDGTIKVNPNTLMNSPVIQSMINNAYNDMSKHFIDLSSKIETATREAYLNVLEQSYLDISMGTHSYDEAIRKSINDLSNEGIRTMSYVTTDEGGNVTGIRNYDIEGVVRRDALTGARQLSGELNQQLIEETECEYVKFSEHLDCRESHFPWQGTIVKASEWKTIADYGDVAGIYGINCRHYVEPYFGDKRGKEEKAYNQEECDNAYKISQKQKYLERGIRKWKRKAEMLEATGDTYYANKSIMKVHQWQDKLDSFTSVYNLNRDYPREYVNGFKDKTINEIPPKSIVDKLNRVNIIADNSIGKIPTNLLTRNVNQFSKLTEKYDMMDFFKENGAIYYSRDTTKYIGAIGYNNEMTNLSINSSYKYFFDKKFLVNKTEEMVKTGWSMPCAEKNYDIYSMTHEFGHTLEMRMFKQKFPQGNNIKYSYYCSDVKNDIIDIALKNNSEEEVLNAISGYGKDKKTQEFFAEAFANMELGKPNIIGKATKKYLEREGILK